MPGGSQFQNPEVFPSHKTMFSPFYIYAYDLGKYLFFIFFQVVGDGVRRGHSFKLFKKRYRLDVGKFKFASRVCEEWNRLGDGVVSAGTVNAFKTRLDHHLRNVRGIYKRMLFSPADGHP